MFAFTNRLAMEENKHMNDESNQSEKDPQQALIKSIGCLLILIPIGFVVFLFLSITSGDLMWR